MIRVAGCGDIMLCVLLLTSESGQASEPSLARLVYFDELDRVLGSDIKSCWVSDQPDSGCLFQQVGSDLALAKSAISSNTVPIMDTALFEGYWMNQFFPLPIDDPDTIEASVDIYFMGLRMAQNLHAYSVANWKGQNGGEVFFSKKSLFVAIMSRNTSAGRRDTIRETWLAELYRLDPNIDHMFFVGKGGIIAVAENDTIVLNVEESYANLAQKMDLAFQWIIRNRNNFTLIARFDDDVYVRSELFLNRVNSMGEKNSWWGAFTHTASPVRDPLIEKEYVSYAQWPMDAFYPLFARGFAYVISTDLIRQAQEQIIDETKDFQVPFDDVQLGIRILHLVQKGTEVIILDNDEEIIAMNADCYKSEWSFVRPQSTMVVHHVDSHQILCMHTVDYTHGNLCQCIHE